MTISELARNAGVSAETIRYYQRIGLLRTPRRPSHGFRAYDGDDALRLRFVRHGQTLGFTLGEIAALLQLTSTDCQQAEQIAKERLRGVQDRIIALRRLEAALERTVMECEERKPHAGCPLIETLLQPDVPHDE